jgi:hypothetical protein
LADAIRVDKYKTLEDFVDMFAKGEAKLVILESEQGLGKTATIFSKLKGIKHLYLSSHITPLSNYIALYDNRNLPVVYEDIDTLFRSPISVAMFKQLTDTKKVKEVQYHSTSHALSVPVKFQTTSNVLVSCNSMNTKNANMEALLSRGFYIQFQPNRKEIIDKMETILPNIDIVSLDTTKRDEVFNYIKKREPISTNFNLRHLVRGLQLKEYSLNNQSFAWKNHLDSLLGVDYRLADINKLLNSKKSVRQQEKEFCSKNKCHRATFYRLKKKVAKSQGF